MPTRTKDKLNDVLGNAELADPAPVGIQIVRMDMIGRSMCRMSDLSFECFVTSSILTNSRTIGERSEGGDRWKNAGGSTARCAHS